MTPEIEPAPDRKPESFPDAPAAYQDYLRRREAGEDLDFEIYCAAHPGLADALRIIHSMQVDTAPVNTDRVDSRGALPVAETRRAPVIPRTIARYEILQWLGEGGMGTVYLAQDPVLGRSVVLKTLRQGPSDGARTNALIRLKREARIAGRLDHPGICSVLDVVDEGGHVFVVMPFIDGESLEARVQKAKLMKSQAKGSDAGQTPFWVSMAGQKPDSGQTGIESEASPGSAAARPGDPSEASRRRGDARGILRLVEKIARAVHEAHEAGVIHRDLKPGNIMVRSNGAPVVLDFGLAFDAFGEEDSRFTREGELLGTPLYMAPEQVEGRISEIDRRSDVYALGIILYQLLVLEPPYSGKSRQSIFHKILRGEPRPPRKLNPAIPRDLEAVCLKAMAREQEDRYATALELAEDLRRVRTLRPTLAKPSSYADRLWRRARRNAWTTAALIASLILAGLALALWHEKEETGEKLDWHAITVQVLLKVSRRDPLSEEEVRRMNELLPDPAALDKFLARPSTEHWDRILERIDARTRTGEGQSLIRPLEPRASVSDLVPRFRFHAPPAGNDTWHFVVTVSGEDGLVGEFSIVQKPGDGEEIVLSLPVGTPELEPGKKYTWKVGLSREHHAKFVEAGIGESRVVTFRLIDPEEKERILGRLGSTGDAGIDGLVRAAVLLTQELAADALGELDEARIPALDSHLEALRLLYLAEARALLGDGEKVRQLRDRYRELDRQLEEGREP